MTNKEIAWLSEGLEVLLAEKAAQPTPPGSTDFDVVIIGSGYGGAIAAARLAGTRNSDGEELRIAVLERGKEYLPGMFPTGLSTLAGHARVSTPWEKKAMGKRDGLFDIRVNSDINALVANGLGGGSLINAGVMETPCRVVFDESWPEPLRGRQALDSLYTSIKEQLGAARGLQCNTIKQHPDLQDQPLDKYRSMEKLGGDKFRAAAVTVAMQDGPNNSQVHMNRCNLCGDCATGCNFGAKDSLDVNLLVEARRRKVRLFTGATVLNLSRDMDAWAVEVIHTKPPLAKREGVATRILAGKVILAAGTFGSSEILLPMNSPVFHWMA